MVTNVDYFLLKRPNSVVDGVCHDARQPYTNSSSNDPPQSEPSSTLSDAYQPECGVSLSISYNYVKKQDQLLLHLSFRVPGLVRRFRRKLGTWRWNIVLTQITRSLDSWCYNNTELAYGKIVGSRIYRSYFWEAVEIPVLSVRSNMQGDPETNLRTWFLCIARVPKK